VAEREFESFAELWNDGRFFEAHEALEALWMRTRDRGQQGLIQLAAALHHVRRGNARGARTMIGRALPRLLDPIAGPSPIDLAQAAAYATRLGEAIDNGDADAEADARPRF
jgi:hypothetical protein